jgi:hypothetical protein
MLFTDGQIITLPNSNTTRCHPYSLHRSIYAVPVAVNVAVCMCVHYVFTCLWLNGTFVIQWVLVVHIIDTSTGRPIKLLLHNNIPSDSDHSHHPVLIESIFCWDCQLTGVCATSLECTHCHLTYKKRPLYLSKQPQIERIIRSTARWTKAPPNQILPATEPLPEYIRFKKRRHKASSSILHQPTPATSLPASILSVSASASFSRPSLSGPVTAVKTSLEK